VVAKEVRNLPMRSAEVAKNTPSMIECSVGKRLTKGRPPHFQVGGHTPPGKKQAQNATFAMRRVT
jgi:hypothetical protein